MWRAFEDRALPLAITSQSQICRDVTESRCCFSVLRGGEG